MGHITVAEAKERIARFCGKSGKCPDDAELDIFLREVVEQLLHRGHEGAIRKWCLYACNGCITLPPEIETPLKVKIGGHVEYVYDKWYEFYDSNTLEECQPCEAGLVEDPNPRQIIYDLPPCGAHIVAVPSCDEDANAHFIIQGLDENSDEIFLQHEGQEVRGEYLAIDRIKLRHTKKVFKKITGIQKTKTKGIVRLYWYTSGDKKKGLLGQYKPYETNPCYRKYRVVGLEPDCCARVEILGRMALPTKFYDNDILPVKSMRALTLIAQQIQAEDNDALQNASYKRQVAEEAIVNENRYNKTNEQVIDFNDVTSAGATICNLI